MDGVHAYAQSLIVPCYIPNDVYELKMVTLFIIEGWNQGVVHPTISSCSETAPSDHENFKFELTDLNGVTDVYDAYDNLNPQGGFSSFPSLATVTVTGSSNLNANATIVDVNTCAQTSGEINVSASGGTQPYLFNLLDDQQNVISTNSTGNFSGLASGVYNVDVVESGGCVFPIQDLIVQNEEIQLNVLETNPCSSDEGRIEVLSASGGVAPYTYNWTSLGVGSVQENLTAGTYECIVTDVNGCTSTFNYTLSNSVSWDFEDLVISNSGFVITDPTPSTPIIIKGHLIIEEGVNFDLADKDFRFLPKSLNGVDYSGVVIEKDAILNVTNCTFDAESTSCNKMWDGFKVLGHISSYIDFNSGLGIMNHVSGKLDMNFSEVNNAIKGIALYNHNAGGQYGNGSGGNVIVKNSTFKNNRISIDIRNQSIFNLGFAQNQMTNCTFINDGLMMDNSLFPNMGQYSFIRLQNSPSNRIIGNDFYGNTNLSIENRGYGLESYNSGVKLSSSVFGDKNKFFELTSAVDITDIGYLSNNLIIDKNLFSKNLKGITVKSSKNGQISNNEIVVSDGLPFPNNSYGIYMSSTKGFQLNENLFKSLSSNSFTYGLILKDLNYLQNDIYKNNFQGDFEAATQLEGENLEVQIDCNVYTGLNNNDWFIFDGELVDQGECAANTLYPSVENQFGNPINKQILNNGLPFTYSSSDYSKIPNNISSNVTINACQSQITMSSVCPSLNNTGVIYVDYDNNFVNGLIQEFEHEVNLIQKKRLKSEIIRYYNLYNKDIRILDFLFTYGSTEADKKHIIEIHFNRGELGEVESLLSELDYNSNEDFVNVYSELVEVYTEFNGYFTCNESLSMVLSSTGAEGAELASTIFKNVFLNRELLNPQTESGKKKLFNEKDESNADLVVYPNPADKEISVSSKESIIQVVITDNKGRMVKTVDVNENSYFKMNVSDLQKGVYTISIKTVSGRTNRKLVIV